MGLQVGNHLGRCGGKPYPVALPPGLSLFDHFGVESLDRQLFVDTLQIHLQIGEQRKGFRCDDFRLPPRQPDHGSVK